MLSLHDLYITFAGDICLPCFFQLGVLQCCCSHLLNYLVNPDLTISHPNRILNASATG